mgnify:CR=1 FL=1
MIEIKIPVTADLLCSITVDLKNTNKGIEGQPAIETETACFLQNVLKTTLSECEHLQVEVDSLIDAGEEAASILSE